MRLDTVVSNLDTLDHAVSAAPLRDVEDLVLIEAFMALHRDGLLTDTEYQYKRLRLAAQR